MQEKITESIISILKSEFEIEIDSHKSTNLVYPTKFLNFGDYQSSIVFALIDIYFDKIEGNSKDEKEKFFASKMIFHLKESQINSLFKEIKNENGHINFYLKDEYIAKEILNINASYGKNDIYKGKKIMVEYTDPNPFKVFHIGHLMTNTIGESFTRLVENGGGKVIRACYQGDVGLHVAKTIWGIMANPAEYFENVKTWQLKDRIVALGNAYSKGEGAYSESDGSGSLLGGPSKQDIKIQINQINKEIFEKTNPQINYIYELGRKWSLEYFETIYKKLDTKFDRYFFESEVAKEGIDMVKSHPEVFEESEGAIVFKGSHTRVFLNSQGLPTYEAKELGLTATKFREYPDVDSSLVITAKEQTDYFKVLQEALIKINPKYIIKQFGHGLLRFSTGKMSSRKGNVISAEELISDIESLVKEKNDQKEIQEIIAIGAIKYSILRQAVGGDIIYDREKSISFEGDSGPYLQYSCVRARSVLTKASSVPIKKTEVGFIDRLILRYPDVVLRAQKEYAPHHIVTYLTALASEFNAFYANNKILDAGDDTGYRLALTKAFVETMQNGLHILAIKVPEKM